MNVNTLNSSILCMKKLLKAFCKMIFYGLALSAIIQIPQEGVASTRKFAN